MDPAYELHFTLGSEEFIYRILELKFKMKMLKEIMLAVFDKYYKGKDILFFNEPDDWVRNLEIVRNRNKLCWYVMVLHIIHLFLGVNVKVYIVAGDLGHMGLAARYLKQHVLDKDKDTITVNS